MPPSPFLCSFKIDFVIILLSEPTSSFYISSTKNVCAFLFFTVRVTCQAKLIHFNIIVLVIGYIVRNVKCEVRVT
jgi:hypothetical protein